MYDKKETKSITHSMKDQKLFPGDMQKVSLALLFFLHEKLHTWYQCKKKTKTY